MQEGPSDAGRKRAAELPVVLNGIPNDAIYTLDIKCNRATAEPLAAERRLPVSIVAERGVAERLIRENAGQFSVTATEPVWSTEGP